MPGQPPQSLISTKIRTTDKMGIRLVNHSATKSSRPGLNIFMLKLSSSWYKFELEPPLIFQRLYILHNLNMPYYHFSTDTWFYKIICSCKQSSIPGKPCQSWILHQNNRYRQKGIRFINHSAVKCSRAGLKIFRLKVSLCCYKFEPFLRF